MSNEESSAPLAIDSKKGSSWDWFWPSIAAGIIVKLFGLVGGLVTFGMYYWLNSKLETRNSKLETWGAVAVAVAGIVGVVAANLALKRTATPSLSLVRWRSPPHNVQTQIASCTHGIFHGTVRFTALDLPPWIARASAT